MWTVLRKEIETIRKELSLSDNQFRPVGLNEWQKIQENVYRTFCKLTDTKGKPIWLWEHLKLDRFTIAFLKTPYNYLGRLIDEDDIVWFFINETVNESGKFWFYQGQIKPIQAIIEKSDYIDELYLVSKKYDWLICINHHNFLISTGQIMPDKLRALSASIKHEDSQLAK